jgi:hypothetical protein
MHMGAYALRGKKAMPYGTSYPTEEFYNDLG